MEHAKVVELEPVEVGDHIKNDNSRSPPKTHILKTFAIKLRSASVNVCSLGASILNFQSTVPGGTDDDNLVIVDIAAGYKDARSMYESGNSSYFNVIVGRVANRIANGTFTIDNETYTMDINNPPNTLHGGKVGFSHKIWEAEVVRNGTAVQFSLNSVNGDEGFPGHVLVTATYSLRPSFTPSGVVLQLEMKARLIDDIPTPINLANHTYFNLSGIPTDSLHDNNGILDHSLTLESDYYTPVDESLIPTREVRSLNVDQTMDFRQERNLKQALDDYGVVKIGISKDESVQNLEQRRPLPSPYGFDHNYVVRKQPGVSLPKVGTLSYNDDTGGTRSLTVFSDAPGVQVYTAHYLSEDLNNPPACKTTYKPWGAICLETQTFPNSIPPTSVLQPSSPVTDNVFWEGKTCILTPSEPTYNHLVLYKLEMDDEEQNSAYQGSDTNGKIYNSIEAMWAEQDLSTWYTRAKHWYEDNCDANIDGVLGGIGHISDSDLLGSREFLKTLTLPHQRSLTISSDPSQQQQLQQQESIACECGAGIGRVTKGLLLDFVDSCELIESNSRLLLAAPDHIGTESHRCKYYCSELQDWQPPSNKKYTIVWIQWVLCYLTDEDIVKFLIRCAESLAEGGWIILKENTCSEEAFVVDVDDASVTRSLEYWLDLIAKSGLQIKSLRWHDGFPDNIFAVPMLALQP
jgi:galactose mutarotase-like enzyme